jgi:xylulose-5-phosphate/fructose-6-phosphate phosphoketolase
MQAATDDEQFGMLQNWLDSYHPESLFDAKGSNIVRPETVEILPDDVRFIALVRQDGPVG